MPKNIARNFQCLMIESKDGRRFFTHEENQIQLLEFCKAFEMSLALVTIIEGEILNLSDMPEAICNASYDAKATYEIIRSILPCDAVNIDIPLVRTRKQILANAAEVRKRIREKYRAGEVVRTVQLVDELEEFGLSAQAISSHHARVKEEMSAKGFKFTRQPGGGFKAHKPEPEKKESAPAKPTIQFTTVATNEMFIPIDWYEDQYGEIGYLT